MVGHRTSEPSPTPTGRHDSKPKQSSSARNRPQRLGSVVLLLTVVAAAGAGAVAAYFQFRPDPSPPGATTEQLLLAALNRTELSPVEVDDRLEVAESLCLADEAVLIEVWAQLEAPESLRFQDFVVSELCPERADLYAQRTGRYVTEDAIKNRRTLPPTTPTLESPGAPEGPSGSRTGPTADEPLSPERSRSSGSAERVPLPPDPEPETGGR